MVRVDPAHEGHQLAAVADAEAERFGAAAEAAQLVAHGRPAEQRRRPAARRSQHVAKAEAAREHQALQPVPVVPVRTA